ncbi:MAG: hypothetical protein RL642_788 [Bacteroidota bacterium]
MGTIAIVLVLQTGETILNQQGLEWKIYLPEKIWWASIFILIAAVIDFLDGFVARLMHATSDMGKQLDSLSDVVSFGVAPGLILYQLLRIAYAAEPSGLETSMLMMLPALLIPMAAAWRLARFNLDTVDRGHFVGLPVPAAGLFIASLPLLMLYNPMNVQSVLLNKWFLYGIIILISWLMVSTLTLLNLKFKNFKFADNQPRFILLGISIPLVLFLGWVAVPAIFISYILVSLLFKNKLS